MPAINVNPRAASPAGTPLFYFLGRNESALRKLPRAVLRRTRAVPAARGPMGGLKQDQDGRGDDARN